MALALGLGSMFNHSKEPNVGFQRDFENKMIRYSTLRDVAPGEELCISYGPNLWFSDMEDEDDAASKDSGYQGSGSRSPRSEFSDSEDETGDRFLSRLQIDNDEE
ncbi:hypothetical protein BGZ52_008756 [Haplosporangium bisporale]|nr:hypothetical protein BGZ52_008756 [Haplosporangium bisporale]